MNVVHALLLFFVAIASAAALEVAANPESPGDGKTEGSPNARLRGALSAEGVYVESDSFGDGEESRFETGAPEFLSCKAIGSVCTYGGHHDYDSFSNQCCSGECAYFGNDVLCCKPNRKLCLGNKDCCSGNCRKSGGIFGKCSEASE